MRVSLVAGHSREQGQVEEFMMFQMSFMDILRVFLEVLAVQELSRGFHGASWGFRWPQVVPGFRGGVT